MLNTLVIRNGGRRRGICKTWGTGGTLALLLLVCGPAALGQSWNGSVSDVWDVAGNWTTNTVPSSSSAAVTIGTAINNPVLLDISATVDTLTLENSDNSLTLLSGNNLTVAGNAISNAGTITIQSSASLLGVVSEQSTSLSGAGTITLAGGTLGTASSSTMATWDDGDNTIEGYGNIGGAGLDPGGLTFANSGTVLANVSGQTLSFSGGTGAVTLTNVALAEATNGGTLEFSNLSNAGLVLAEDGGTVETAPTANLALDGEDQLLEAGSGGTLLLGQSGGSLNYAGPLYVTANGGAVVLAGDIIGAGYASFTTENGGTITVNGAAVDLVEQPVGLVITGGSTLTANDSIISFSDSAQSVLSNSGTIVLNNSELDFSQNVTQTISGGGTITMNSGYIDTSDIAGGSLTNADNTIQGTGTIGIDSSSSFTNAGTLNANVASGTLTIDASGAFSNQGTMEATNGGTLSISGGVTNTGTVSVGSGSTLTATGVYTQSGGTTTVAGTLIAPTVNINGGLLDGSGAVQGSVTVASGATIQPGDQPATLEITGSLSLNSATLNELIGGDIAGSYGVLDVSGAFSIVNSVLSLEDLNGFTPMNGESFDIANSDGLTGLFSDSSIAFGDGTFSVSYATSGCAVGYENCVDLTYAAAPAPEPGTALLLGMVLVSLLLGASRKLLLAR